MPDSNTRPVEVHFRGLSAVDRSALPLLSSMVDGELYAAEMLNARGLGVTQPGVFCGYKPKVKNGLTFTITKDSALGYSAGLCEIGLQQFHIIQQHDIDITVQTGYKWIVVLEAFYEKGVATTQVSSDSNIDAASVKAIREYELRPDHQIICEIDLTSGKTSIDINDFDVSNRNDQDFTIGSHIAKEDPHTQYPLRSELDELVNGIINGSISQDATGDDPTVPVSQKAIATALSNKADSEHSHDADDLPKGGIAQAGIIELVASYNSSSTSHAPTAKALKDGLADKADADHGHTADELPTASTTDPGIIRLSNSYTSDSKTQAATPKALKDGLGTKADSEHSHDASTLPKATTTQFGVVKRSDNHLATTSETVASSKALNLGLETKGDKSVLIESSASMIITRGGAKTTILRIGTGNATIQIDASTFEPSDEIVIINSNPNAGTVDITNIDGKLYDLDNSTPASSTLTGKGRAEIIRLNESNALRALV